jgi:hypothetical protein
MSSRGVKRRAGDDSPILSVTITERVRGVSTAKRAGIPASIERMYACLAASRCCTTEPSPGPGLGRSLFEYGSAHLSVHAEAIIRALVPTRVALAAALLPRHDEPIPVTDYSDLVTDLCSHKIGPMGQQTVTILLGVPEDVKTLAFRFDRRRFDLDVKAGRSPPTAAFAWPVVPLSDDVNANARNNVIKLLVELVKSLVTFFSDRVDAMINSSTGASMSPGAASTHDTLSDPGERVAPYNATLKLVLDADVREQHDKRPHVDDGGVIAPTPPSAVVPGRDCTDTVGVVVEYAAKPNVLRVPSVDIALAPPPFGLGSKPPVSTEPKTSSAVGGRGPCTAQTTFPATMAVVDGRLVLVDGRSSGGFAADVDANNPLPGVPFLSSGPLSMLTPSLIGAARITAPTATHLLEKSVNIAAVIEQQDRKGVAVRLNLVYAVADSDTATLTHEPIGTGELGFAEGLLRGACALPDTSTWLDRRSSEQHVRSPTHSATDTLALQSAVSSAPRQHRVLSKSKFETTITPAVCITNFRTATKTVMDERNETDWNAARFSVQQSYSALSPRFYQLIAALRRTLDPNPPKVVLPNVKHGSKHFVVLDDVLKAIGLEFIDGAWSLTTAAAVSGLTSALDGPNISTGKQQFAAILVATKVIAALKSKPTPPTANDDNRCTPQSSKGTTAATTTFFANSDGGVASGSQKRKRGSNTRACLSEVNALTSNDVAMLRVSAIAMGSIAHANAVVAARSSLVATAAGGVDRVVGHDVSDTDTAPGFLRSVEAFIPSTDHISEFENVVDDQRRCLAKLDILKSSVPDGTQQRVAVSSQSHSMAFMMSGIASSLH